MLDQKLIQNNERCLLVDRNISAWLLCVHEATTRMQEDCVCIAKGYSTTLAKACGQCVVLSKSKGLLLRGRTGIPRLRKAIL